MNPEYVGILLNAKMHRGIETGRTGQESLPLYEEGAALYGLKPAFLRLEDIDIVRGTSRAYVKGKSGYVRTLLQTPCVIHNRAIYGTSSAVRKIGRLQQSGITVFNFNNRYGKDQIHRLLAEHPRLSAAQPESLPGTASNIRLMMKQYDDLILKPVSASVGRGIMRLKKTAGGWKLVYKSTRSGRKWIETSVSERSPLPKPALRLFAKVPYLVQERLPLAEIDGRPFDLRVSVQRGLDGNFGITGMFGKISAPGMFLSNIAQGGSPYPAEQLLSQIFPGPMAAVVLSGCRSLALETARYLSERLPLLADLGMDIGVTPSGHAYFIECNGRDQRYGFREAGMEAVWAESYRKPMAFAYRLLHQQQEQISPFSFQR